MRKHVVALGMALVVFVILLPAGFGQQNTAPDKTAAVQDKTVTCELTKVDEAARTITARDPDGKELTFTYNNETNIINPDQKTKGLAGKTGARMIVSYREEKDGNRATEIQFVE